MEKGLGTRDIQDEHIIFFDGVCHLCNSVVDSIITKDRHHRFKFAPLQGETALRLLPTEVRLNLNSVIYFEAGQIYDRSNAVLKIAKRLGGVYLILTLGWILPKVIRDLAYNFVAKNRYAWFGKRDTCRLALPEERVFLLP